MGSTAGCLQNSKNKLCHAAAALLFAWRLVVVTSDLFPVQK